MKSPMKVKNMFDVFYSFSKSAMKNKPALNKVMKSISPKVKLDSQAEGTILAVLSEAQTNSRASIQNEF